ncbi:putative vacuolar protein sorting-associated protein Ist1 [Dioscorea sansibarensis]
MLGGLLGSKFINKCKHSVKCINSRLVVITRKKQVTVRFLKKDVADLISRGLDSIAFGRIDALIVEINHARCYDMIEKYCESILNLLPSMQKQRECPEDAKEAVSTLNFAAARFSDLPELCELRRAFLERFGSYIESFVNSEFMENMQKKSFSVDKKLQLMQEIAQEFSVSWDFKTFRQKLSNSAPASDECRKGGHVRNGNHEPSIKMLSRGNGADNNVRCKILPKDRYEATPKPVIQKQDIQPGLKDIIHVISSANDGRSRDPSSKSRLAFADEPENIEPPTRPSVPPYSQLNARIVESDKLKDKQVGDAISHKQQPSSVQQVGLVKSQDNKPVYSVPPYTKTKVANDAAHAVDHTQDNPSFKRLSKDEDVLDPSGHERQPVRQLNYGQDRVMNKVPPPYVKPSINQVNADQNGGPPAHDIKDVKTSDRQIPRSVRSTRTKQPVLDEIDGSIDDRKQLRPTPDLRKRQSGLEHAATCNDDKYGEGMVRDPRPNGSMAGEVADKSARTPTEGIRQVGKQRATAYGDAFYDEGKVTGLKLAMAGEIGDAIDYGKLMSRASKYQGRQGHRSSTVTQNEDHYGEKKTSNPKSLDADQEDNAIHFGKLLHGQRREGGRRATNYDRYRDDEERAMDRLLMHYSRKGMPESTSTGTRGSASGHAVNEGAPYNHQEGKSAKPLLHERVASLPPQPVSPREVRAPTRATSLQPDLFASAAGRAHPRMPDYEEVAAQMAALRAKP